ncbi:MAG: hypothetical protein CMM08_19660 [Rhodospirillaceae bacterium]|nr:hypothetical protein [Rhodospirillaceae bacterium]
MTRRSSALIALTLSICALAQKTIPSVIAGASNDDQLEQNLEAVGWTLTADDLVEIERLSTD